MAPLNLKDVSPNVGIQMGVDMVHKVHMTYEAYTKQYKWRICDDMAHEARTTHEAQKAQVKN